MRSTLELNPQAQLQRLESVHHVLSAGDERHEIELYSRSAVTLRVALHDGTQVRTKRGEDEGFALRSTGPEGHELAFVAGSALRGAEVKAALDGSRRFCGRIPRQPLWPHDEGTRDDSDGECALPEARELWDWLQAARDALDPIEPARPDEMWVEVAATVECWFASGGLRATRARRRAWALFKPRGRNGGLASRPLIVARRRWAAFPVDAIKTRLEDRVGPQGAVERPPSGRASVLFSPECAARLVHALATRIHGSEAELGAPVGPGWRLTDDPGHPDAIYGGDFDDAGFTARHKELANGRVVVGRLDGPGHLRRPSFRDRPQSLPSYLSLPPGGGAPPARTLVVTGMEIHPFEADRWTLRLEGSVWGEGAPAAPLAPSTLRIAPRDLVRRCATAIGPARLSYLGVRTPALLFENLNFD